VFYYYDGVIFFFFFFFFFFFLFYKKYFFYFFIIGIDLPFEILMEIVLLLCYIMFISIPFDYCTDYYLKIGGTDSESYLY
jgi:hypothetical protein